jgi:hypothetical protein
MKAKQDSNLRYGTVAIGTMGLMLPSIKGRNGLAIIRYKEQDSVEKYEMLLSVPYRGKQIGVFRPKP